MGGEGGWRQWMRWKNNYLIAVATCNNGKFRQRFMPGVPRTFDHDCSSHISAMVGDEGFPTSATGLRYMRTPMNYIGDQIAENKTVCFLRSFWYHRRYVRTRLYISFREKWRRSLQQEHPAKVSGPSKGDLYPSKILTHNLCVDLASPRSLFSLLISLRQRTTCSQHAYIPVTGAEKMWDAQ